jgi:hypothetical protein
MTARDRENHATIQGAIGVLGDQIGVLQKDVRALALLRDRIPAGLSPDEQLDMHGILNRYRNPDLRSRNSHPASD